MRDPALAPDSALAPDAASGAGPDFGRRWFHGWVLLAVLWLGMAFNTALPLYGLSILNVHMGDEMHFNRAILGTAYAIYMLMTGLPGPLVARMIDRLGVRTTLVFGNLLLAGGALAMASLVTGPIMLCLVAGGVIGAANAFGGPIALQACVTRWFARRRALAMGIMLTGGSLTGIGFAPMLERLVTQTSSWRLGWWLIGATALVLALLCAWQIIESPEAIGQVPDGSTRRGDPARQVSPRPSRVHQTQEHWTFRHVLRAPTFWLLLLCSAGVSGVYTIFLAQGVLQIRDLGYSTSEAANLISLSVAAGFAAHVVFSVLADRIEPKLIWAGALLLQGLGISLFAHAVEPWMMQGAVVAIGIGSSTAILCIIMVFGNWFGPHASHFVFGFGSAVAAAFGALGPIAAGVCYDRFGTFAPVFDGVAVICAAGALLLALLRPPRLRAS